MWFSWTNIDTTTGQAGGAEFGNNDRYSRYINTDPYKYALKTKQITTAK